ncbi:MFS transporter [Streptomyces sp. SID8379]|uniref:MFS transporter n=1 Tax=unclassified Streptomyces TaxID=2593676 RepID=UPI00036A0FE4|nr:MULTISPECIES: MFS transporter [unclassified Streptomyces]MYW68712.1 MFS transporter [Streptomyces sp. SID8379]
MEATKPGSAGPTDSAGSGRIVAVLAFGGIVASVMQTLVVPLLGELPSILDTSASNATWVVTVTLLAAAVATPIMGRLGDLYGKRRMLLISTVPLIAGSIVAALSTNLTMMIVGRGLQGMGVGLVPLGISLLRDLVPPEKLGTSIALMSASLGIGGALGLPFASAVADYGSWRVLFWVSAGLSAAIAVLYKVVIPDTERRREDAGGFDYAGAVGLGIGLVALLLAVSKGADWGWGSGTTLGLFAVAVVVLLGWGVWELRTKQPMVDLRTTARPQVLLTNAASVVVGFAMYASSLIVPQLLQLPKETGYGLGQSMMAMGLWMMPGGLMMMIVAPLGGKLTGKQGPKVTLLLGSVVIAIGYGISVFLMGAAWQLTVVMCVITAGVGLAYGAMPALIMGGVPQSETAAANSFNTLMRSIGTSASSAVIGVVLSQMTVTLGGYVLPSEDAFRTGMLIGCGVAVAAALITLTIPYRKAMTPAAPEPGPTQEQAPQAGAAQA